MRIIRTEMFFPPSDVRQPIGSYAKTNPGVSFAFFADSENPVIRDVRPQLVGDVLFQESHQLRPLSERAVRSFLDIALRNASLNSLRNYIDFNEALERYEIRNTDAVAAVYDGTFVYQNSPPGEIKVADLAKLTGKVGAGIFLGVVGLNQPLLFLTVPLGVILVGSAIGVSKAPGKRDSNQNPEAPPLAEG